MSDDIDLSQELDEAHGVYFEDSPEKFLSRPAVWAIMWDKSLGKCWYCGREMNPFRDFSIIIPLSEGGQDLVYNITYLCPNCHRLAHSIKYVTDCKILADGWRI